MHLCVFDVLAENAKTIQCSIILLFYFFIMLNSGF